jgi:hypothetical protein
MHLFASQPASLEVGLGERAEEIVAWLGGGAVELRGEIVLEHVASSWHRRRP